MSDVTSEVDDRLSVDSVESVEVPDDRSLNPSDIDLKHNSEKCGFIETRQEQCLQANDETDSKVLFDDSDSISWSEVDEPTSPVTATAEIQTAYDKRRNTKSEHVNQFVIQHNNVSDARSGAEQCCSNKMVATSITTFQDNFYDSNSKDSFIECIDSNSSQCNNISDFSDWSDSLQDAVNESLINGTNVALISRPADNVVSSVADLPTESPISLEVLESPERLSVGGHWKTETPKRHQNEQDYSTEPPSSRQRLMSSREAEEWAVSPLRRTLNAKLSLT